MKKENLEVLLGDINSKFNLVLEGHEVLRIEEKVDALAAGLSAHRADTEAHHGAYHVMEREG